MRFTRNIRLLILFSAFFILGVVVILRLSHKNLVTAAESAAAFSFLPNSVSFPPDTTLQLMVNAVGSKIGYVKTEIDFNPNMIQLNGEASPSGALKNIVSQTSMIDANSTGKLVMIYSLNPEDLALAPTGLFQVAALPFKISPLEGGVVNTAQVSINITNSEVVDLTAANINLSATPTDIVISAPAPGNLTGTVYSSLGKPLINASISYSASGATKTYTSNSSGNYTISNLNPGAYTIKYSAKHYLSASYTVTITSGATTIENVTLNHR